MKIRVFDTEGVGLNSNATKLWNLCYTEDGEGCEICCGEGKLMGGPDTFGLDCPECKGSGLKFHYTTNYDTMREWLQEPDVLWVGHYSIGHDMPAINAVLGVGMTYKQFWDTMYVSWALFPERPKHGLEALGIEHGFPKVAVSEDQWEEGDPVLMRERVERDVLINWYEYQKQLKRLESLYDT